MNKLVAASATLKPLLAPRSAFAGLAVRFMSTPCEKYNLTSIGIHTPTTIFHNLSYPEIALHEAHYKEGHFVSNGTFAVDTGIFTGRSPKDKYVVKNEGADQVDWNNINQPISEEIWADMKANTLEYMNKAERLYVYDCFCGTNKKTRKAIRFLFEKAWQMHFVKNMFIRPSVDELADFKPDFQVINSCGTVNPKWKEHGLNSDVYAAFNLKENLAVIGGTYYGGENKKGIFALMNYTLPQEGIMSMHCSANKGMETGDTCLFFGLSGTGKTTLSADPSRYLIGDDEHGWDDDGIFNFEQGCYAKTINLSEENEPDIYRAIKPDALLENNFIVPETNWPDFANTSKTQNGRVSYPIYHIPNFEPSGSGTHPANCVFLTCDAFGVLPPVSRLSDEQAVYHFLSGYTAKVAGTERGINEPTATFSAGFGAAFLTLHPTKYADLLVQKLKKHGTKTWLVNTGWSGGSAGVGERMSIKVTRKCISGILDGSINGASFVKDDLFGFEYPTALPGVPDGVLTPKETWADKAAYDETAKKLANMFVDNYKKYQKPGMTDYSVYGPQV
jgi:ATP-dependent phosphoenolpyruvate carboxykinase|uniref:phosphoenolpyruvate carboxykinase (ATP) n=1 Tax=Fibrocapsa japonica TaxID=94617 RepID=A0A7S2UVQ5_9STRA|mmetsp:Transcript_11083/g.16321  ORF Transcript_11083/g.16321 Transcript_11083/m.16321 type:complete len:560 (+) Transcript_11083:64-1743(+)|eukprot:CAMPEP_0113941288 /NCGR_PEP_ID=MMETSP1339-20121228/7232_1 /TAXON_ID=94617 /ORGANISM="Fibrocapsa japonica" /LENGTH=559 /DNA_ID=CAMNT_0000945391 /DNA_START=35 /DNA_END=1714 /DNA_ORIENTATION=+ /assembly_acc=CAM_ASM_000762